MQRVQTLRRVLRKAHAAGVKRRVLSAWGRGELNAQTALAMIRRHGADVTATEYRLMRAADDGVRVDW